MNDSLEHLPEHKRDELRRLTETIREACDDVEMVVLYGSYARGDYKEEADLRYFAERVELLMSETKSRCETFLQALPESP